MIYRGTIENLRDGLENQELREAYDLIDRTAPNPFTWTTSLLYEDRIPFYTWCAANCNGLVQLYDSSLLASDAERDKQRRQFAFGHWDNGDYNEPAFVYCIFENATDLMMTKLRWA